MKKKIVAVVTAAVLALSCFATVSAAKYSSPSALMNKAIKVAEDASIVSSGDVTVDKDSNLEVVPASSFDVEAVAAIAHLFAQYPKDKCVKVFGISGDTDNEDPAELVIVSDEIKTDNKYALRVMNVDTGEWSNNGISVISIKTGIAKFNVTKTGIYAFVKAKNATNVQSTKVAESNNVKKVSPKTGEQ